MSLNSNNEVLLGTALTALSTLLCKLGMSYLPFVLPVQRVLMTAMGNQGVVHKPNIMHQVGLWCVSIYILEILIDLHSCSLIYICAFSI